MREGGKAIYLLEDTQEELGGLDGIEAAEVLEVLVKPPDDQLHCVVGPGYDLTFDAIDQGGPVPLQEVEDDYDGRRLLHVALPQGHHFVVPLLGRACGLNKYLATENQPDLKIMGR